MHRPAIGHAAAILAADAPQDAQRGVEQADQGALAVVYELYFPPSRVVFTAASGPVSFPSIHPPRLSSNPSCLWVGQPAAANGAASEGGSPGMAVVGTVEVSVKT